MWTQDCGQKDETSSWCNPGPCWGEPGFVSNCWEGSTVNSKSLEFFILLYFGMVPRRPHHWVASFLGRAVSVWPRYSLTRNRCLCCMKMMRPASEFRYIYKTIYPSVQECYLMKIELGVCISCSFVFSQSNSVDIYLRRSKTWNNTDFRVGQTGLKSELCDNRKI